MVDEPKESSWQGFLRKIKYQAKEGGPEDSITGAIEDGFLGNYQDAIDTLDEVLLQSFERWDKEERAAAFAAKATMLENLDRHEEAESAFDKAIELNSEESSFLAWKFLHIENVGYPDVKNILDTTELNQKLDSLTNPMHLKMISLAFNDNFIESEAKQYEEMRNYFLKQYEKNQKMLEMIGKPAINFTYPDMDSNMVSLSDFKGSYVYVDVWATWCGPCKYEIPFLIQLEKDYHDANIIFMSVSIDVEKGFSTSDIVERIRGFCRTTSR